MSVYTTLNKIRKCKPCTNGWEKLLISLNKTQPDDEPLALTYILDSNGLNDAIWCLRALPDKHRDKIVLFTADVAERVLPIYEKQHPNDFRPRHAIQAARDFIDEKIDKKTLDAAVSGAWAAWAAAADVFAAAPRDAAPRDAARNAARAVLAVFAADVQAPRDAARDARNAARAVDDELDLLLFNAEKQAQVELFHKHFGEQS